MIRLDLLLWEWWAPSEELGASLPNEGYMCGIYGYADVCKRR